MSQEDTSLPQHYSLCQGRPDLIKGVVALPINLGLLTSATRKLRGQLESFASVRDTVDAQLAGDRQDVHMRSGRVASHQTTVEPSKNNSRCSLR